MAKAQIIRCKCGKVFAGCMEPFCYTEKDWMKDLRGYVQKGCTVELIESNEFSMEKCICAKTEKTEPNLFQS